MELTLATCLLIGTLIPFVRGGACPLRDEHADDATRRCLKACTTSSDCAGTNEQCLCDGSCGLSCYNPAEVTESTTSHGTRSPVESTVPSLTTTVPSHRPSLEHHPVKRTIRRGCDQPTNRNNGFPIAKRTWYLPGSRVTYTCNKGYYGTGNFIAECSTWTGPWIWTWSEPKFICSKQKCSTHSEVINGHISGTVFLVDDILTYDCDLGYISISYNKRKCSAGPANSTSGIWTGSAPTCEAEVTESKTSNEDWVPSGFNVPSQTTTVPLQSPPPAVCNRDSLKNLTFPAVHVEETSYSEEKCKGSGVSRGAVRCVLDIMAESASVIRNFDPRTFVKIECNDTIDDVITKASSKSESATATLKTLQVLTSNPANTSTKDILMISNFLEKLGTSDEQISDSDAASNIETVSHLSQSLRANTKGTDSSEVAKAKQSLVKSIFAVSRKLNTTQSSFVAVSQEISLEVREVSATKPASVTFHPQFHDFNGSNNAIRPVSITLPAGVSIAAHNELIQSGNRSPMLRIATVAYRDSSLFPFKEKADWVVASEIGNHERSVDVSSLQERVEIVYHELKEHRSKQQLTNFKMKLTRLKCVFWDFEKEDWSQDGCCLVPEDPPRCLCNHLTNFAVLVSKEDLSADVALSVVSFIGCSLSVLGFFLTFLVLVSVKSLRKSKPMQVVMHICVCMGSSFIVFMAGVDKTGSPVGCSVITAILHYGFLVSWLWMAVYSHMLYMSIVKVMQSVGTLYNVRKASLLAYGLPVVIVIFNAGLTLGYFDRNERTSVCGERDEFAESFYNAPNFCWLQKYSLYFGFLLPVGLFLIFNVVMFIQVLKKIAFKKMEVRSKSSKSTRQNLTIAVVMATMMGLSWLTGYFMLLSDNMTYLTAMSWLFSGINSLQGVLVFVSTCVRTGELQKLLRDKLRSEVGYSSGTNSTSATATV